MVVLVAYGGGHIAILARVYKYLIAQGVDAKLIPLTTAVPYCVEHSLDFLKIEDYFNLEDLVEPYRSFIQNLADKSHNDQSKIPYKHTLAYHGIGMEQIFTEKNFDEGVKHFEELGRKAFLPINFAEKLLDILQPKGIITTNVPRMELAFRMKATEKGIRTYAIDDLVGYFRDIQNIFSDVVFVDNEMAKKRVLGYGYEGEIIISGNPVYEDIFKKRKQAHRKENNHLLIILQTGVSNMGTNRVSEFSNQFYQTFFAKLDQTGFLQKFDEVKVRFHPSMNKVQYWNDEKIKIDIEKDIHQSLLSSSYVLGFTSTAVYEAYLIGCKVFNLSFKKEYFRLPMNYIGQIDLDGSFHFHKENPDPLYMKGSHMKKSLEIIYNKLANEVF